MQQLHKSHFIWSDLKPGLGRDVGGCLAPLWRRGDLERSFLVLEINEKAVGNWSLWCKIFECKLLGNIGAWKTCWLFCTTMSSQTCHERLFHRRSLRNTRTLSSHSRRPEKTCFPLYNIGNLDNSGGKYFARAHDPFFYRNRWSFCFRRGGTWHPHLLGIRLREGLLSEKWGWSYLIFVNFGVQLWSTWCYRRRKKKCRNASTQRTPVIRSSFEN